jgi:hypothetical protein
VTKRVNLDHEAERIAVPFTKLDQAVKDRFPLLMRAKLSQPDDVPSLQPRLGLRPIYGRYFEAPGVIRTPLHGIGVQGRELCSDRRSTCDCSRGAAL